MPDLPAVLVVDDDASTQGLLVAVIKHLGLRPLTAGNGHEALAIIVADDPAAIILDLIMPVLDGFEVLQRLNASSPYVLRRVIVVTAAMGSRVDDCRELQQVWSFFRKPMDIEQLSASLIACVAASEEKVGRGSTHVAQPWP
jgi:CheY-like chemotaxis protein